jgi:hypothetical protein
MNRFSNENASSGGLIGLFLLFFFGGLLFACEGFMADWIAQLANSQLPGPVSQDSFNCIRMITLVIMASPTLWLIYIGVDHILNNFKEYPGET